MEWPPPRNRLTNGTPIAIAQESDDANSKISECTRREKPLVERPSITSEIGSQLDSFDLNLQLASVLEAKLQPFATELFKMFLNHATDIPD